MKVKDWFEQFTQLWKALKPAGFELMNERAQTEVIKMFMFSFGVVVGSTLNGAKSKELVDLMRKEMK